MIAGARRHCPLVTPLSRRSTAFTQSPARYDMLKRTAIPISLVVILCALLLPIAASAQQAAPTSLLVKLVPGLSPGEQAAVIARNGGVETSSIAPLRLHVVEVPADQLVAVLGSYRADPQVESAEENRTRSTESGPGV